MPINPHDPNLTAFVLGELDEAARKAVEADVAASPELQQLVEEIRQTTRLLAEHLDAEPAPGLTQQQRHELTDPSITRTATDKDRQGRASVARNSRRYLAWGALAASLFVSCGVAWWQARSVSDVHIVAAHLNAQLSQTEANATSSAARLSSLARLSDQYEGARANRLMKPQLTRGREDASAADPFGDADPFDGGKPIPATTRLAEFGIANHSTSRPSALGVESPIQFSGGYMGATNPPAQHEFSIPRVLITKTFELLDSTPVPVRPDEGTGPGQGGDQFATIVDNPFREVKNSPLSTFSIDVDTASYSKVRMYLMEHRTLPPRDAVRIEELINYFQYDYPRPRDSRPFAAHLEVAACPWQAGHQLVRIGIKGREIERTNRPSSNLVFLLDVSGSMNHPRKLPLLKRGMKRLVDQLDENDRVAIVVYAGAAGLVLPPTSGDRKPTILAALDQLHAGGSTNGGQGIRLAYQLALDNLIQGGTNRVVLGSDGDFNVGTTSTSELVELVANGAKDGVFLSVLGFGMGNHNDVMLENISNKGNGNYAFIDTDSEAQKVLVEELSGTLVTIAKDVKIQIEFNPAQVAAYRLIGYENRVLAAEDFNDDKKDAGEIGAGHTVTALYEIVPAAAQIELQLPPVDKLKYQQQTKLTAAAESGELATLKIRYKEPDARASKLLSFPVRDHSQAFGQASADLQFAAAVASWGMLLRNSPHRGDTSYDAVLEIATQAIEQSDDDYRRQFLTLVERAKELSLSDGLR